MKIKDVVLSKGLTGFYFDDQKAIRRGGNFVENGLAYDGEPLTPGGFTSIRQAGGESVSVQLILENGAGGLRRLRGRSIFRRGRA